MQHILAFSVNINYIVCDNFMFSLAGLRGAQRALETFLGVSMRVFLEEFTV